MDKTSSSLLTSKLHLPVPRAKLVSRPRLLARLDEGLRCKLTLISAPAGFGKTTLLSEWIVAFKPDDVVAQYRVAWLSLDESDNNPNYNPQM